MSKQRRENAPPESEDGELRRLYARMSPAESSEHVDEGTWERFACHELTPDERERVLDHMTRCPSCSQIYRGLLILQTEARGFDPGVPAASATAARVAWLGLPRWAFAYGGVAAAALLVLAILVPSVLRRDVTTPRSGGDVRSGDTRTLTPASQITLLEPLGMWSASPARFRWQPLTGAQTYRVRLYTEDGMLIWTSADLSASVVERPGSVSLKPGKYYWQVAALRDGETVAESTLSSFTLAR